MSLIVSVYPVPWKILALVKARILKNRAKKKKEGEGWDPDNLKRQMQLQPGPLSRFKKQEPSFILGDETASWLPVPSAAANEEHEFACIVDGFPQKPFKATADSFTYEENLQKRKLLKLKVKQITSNNPYTDDAYDTFTGKGIIASGTYDGSLTENDVPLQGYTFANCTFEGFIDFPDVTPSAQFFQDPGRWYWTYTADIVRTRWRVSDGEQVYYDAFSFGPARLEDTWNHPLQPSKGGLNLDYYYYSANGFYLEREQTTVTSEFQAYTIQPSTKYPGGTGLLELVVTIKDKESNNTVIQLVSYASVYVSSNPSEQSKAALTLGCLGTNGGEVKQTEYPLGSRRLHFAVMFANNSNYTAAINGQRVLSGKISTPIFDPAKEYIMNVEIRCEAKDDPYVQISEASAFSFSGIRFTAGSNLYPLPTFTPPTSITAPA